MSRCCLLLISIRWCCCCLLPCCFVHLYWLGDLYPFVQGISKHRTMVHKNLKNVYLILFHNGIMRDKHFSCSECSVSHCERWYYGVQSRDCLCDHLQEFSLKCERHSEKYNKLFSHARSFFCINLSWTNIFQIMLFCIKCWNIAVLTYVYQLYARLMPYSCINCTADHSLLLY